MRKCNNTGLECTYCTSGACEYREIGTGKSHEFIKWNEIDRKKDERIKELEGKLELIVERLGKELEIAEEEKSRCVFQGLPYFDSVKGYVNGLHNAIATVKEVGGMNE